jgi:hypothetical protein
MYRVPSLATEANAIDLVTFTEEDGTAQVVVERCAAVRFGDRFHVSILPV